MVLIVARDYVLGEISTKFPGPLDEMTPAKILVQTEFNINLFIKLQIDKDIPY